MIVGSFGLASNIVGLFLFHGKLLHSHFNFLTTHRLYFKNMVTPTAMRTNAQLLRLVHRVLSTYQLTAELLQEVSLQHKNGLSLHHLLVLTIRPPSLIHLYTDIQPLPVPHLCKPQMRWLLPNHLVEVAFS